METAYYERLKVPMRWWALATMFWVTTLLAFLVAMPTLVAIVFVGTLAGVTFLWFGTYGGAVVRVEEEAFQAGRARIPLALLGGAEALDQDRMRGVLGVEADARAYLLVRPYLARGVRVSVLDPADPAPYWIVSTRHPRTLAAALNGHSVSAATHGAD